MSQLFFQILCVARIYHNTMRQNLCVNRLLVGLGGLGLGEGVGGQSLLLGLHDGHVVGKRLLGTNLTAGIPGQHDLDLEIKYFFIK